MNKPVGYYADVICGFAPGSWVEFVVENDPKTWVIHFTDDVTTEQQNAAQAYIQTLDLNAPTLDDYTAAVESYVNAVAKSKNYTDGVSLASYKDSTIPQWAAEATAFIAWRDHVWAQVYATMAAVQGGQQAQPTIDQLLAALPDIVWPA